MFTIISDGSCDLDPVLAKEKGIEVVPFYCSFDSQNYKKEIAEIGIRDFYEEMVANPTVFPKTSMPSVDDYMNVFLPHVKNGDEILCLCITTKFSGSYNSAMTAKSMIEEDYENAVIHVVDTQMDTVLQGLFVLQIVKLRDAGYSITDALAKIEELIPTGRIFFTVGSVDYLLKGGRAGKVAGAMVGALGIKPLIILSEGEIHLGGIARGRKKSLDKTIEIIKKHFADGKNNIDEYDIVVGFGYDRQEAEEFRAAVCEATGKPQSEIDIFQIGATIAVHTGPYPLGVGLVKKSL